MKLNLLILLCICTQLSFGQMNHSGQSIYINQATDYALDFGSGSISAGNSATVSQYGYNNQSTINQVSSGIDNHAITVQKGSVVNKSAIYQSNQDLFSLNSALAYQLGSYNVLEYLIDGTRNSLSSLQFGDFNNIDAAYLSAEDLLMESVQVAFRNQVSVENIHDSKQNISVQSRNKSIDNLLLVDMIKYGLEVEKRILQKSKNGEMAYQSESTEVKGAIDPYEVINQATYKSLKDFIRNNDPDLSIFQNGELNVFSSEDPLPDQLITLLYNGKAEDFKININKDKSEITIQQAREIDKVWTTKYDGKPIIWIRQIDNSSQDMLKNKASDEAILDLIITIREIEQMGSAKDLGNKY